MNDVKRMTVGMAVQVPPVTWRRDHVGLPLRLRGAWRRRSHGVVRSTAVHCYEHKRYLKHFKRYLKHLSMTNNNERRLHAWEAAEALCPVVLPL